MDTSDYLLKIEELERDNRILRQKLNRSIENRALLEEMLETHSIALKTRNDELEESREQLKKSESRFRFLAHHDSLTELPNRIFFNEELHQAILRAKEANIRVALLFVDLDNFKSVNDTFGHEVGDMLLNQAANRLISCSYLQGMVARIGGDEFAILVEKFQNLNIVEEYCKRIIEVLSKPFIILDHTCSIGASIGISLYPSDDTDAVGLLQKADSAMYSVKKFGANNFQFHQDT